MPLTVEDIKEIEVQEIKIRVAIIPIAASGVQFVLLNEINEVRSVGFMDFNGSVDWKFGEPDKYKEDIEEELRKLFECGAYWVG